ncbi:MAG TPA: TetR/AcrR family transcriptional regulator [Candidatus Limnocylindria bacterium]|jgi:AcrR family transcriptional regulator|nr:TetR/AcrR family transcriptional regulator [Candidatus Limnocylindria bacterium]
MSDKKPKAAKPRTKPLPRVSAGAGKREQNKERTKELILAAALELFRKHGLEATTTKQISKQAGIAEGTLFNYFKTKEDLALFFFQKETQDLIEWFQGQSRLQAAPLPEKLFGIIHRQLEYIAPYEDFIGSVFFRSLQPRSKLSPLSLDSQELRLKYLQFIRGVLLESEEKGEIPPVGDLGAYGVGLFYIGMVLHWLHDESPDKQKTLALLDRSLTVGSRVLKKGGWDW